MACGVVVTWLHRCASFAAIPLCLLVYLFQMAMYDYYLIEYSFLINAPRIGDVNMTDIGNVEGFNVWYLMVIPDVFVLTLFITAFVKCHRHFTTSSRNRSLTGNGGELPFGYIAWGGYSILNAIKVILIFRWIAPILQVDDTLGLNMIKTVVAVSSIVFITLVLNHHDAEPNSSRETLIRFLMNTVALDILDTVEMLQVLLYKESHIVLSFMLHKVVIGIASINLVLPTVLLVALSKSRFGQDEAWTKRLKAIHKIVEVIFINIPLLILRVILWHVHRQTVSVFLVKNCIALGWTLHTSYTLTVSAIKPEEEAESVPWKTEMTDLSAENAGKSEKVDQSRPALA
ncbi:hypothetical protein LSH36_52g07083 [Paralvinella palmiformis]|uniref:Uncharacterized protein n=1 Tax=Paralvinella palmiformis TaxID=53620 RepID=A0AAD9NEH5_9ANNE|nr:hypothetical protein LSH36_52g07083 [Paralvinella palmiformis]